MSDTNHYAIILRNADLYLELSSDDSVFIGNQLQKWYESMLDEDAIPLKIAAPASPPEPAPAAAVPPPPAPEPQPVAAAPEPVVAPPPEPVSESAPAPELVAEPVQQPLPEPAPEPVAPPVEEPAMSPAAQDDFEAVMDSLMEDLGTPVEGEPEPAAAGVATATLPPPGMQSSPNGKPDLGLIDSLADLCDKAQAHSPEDYLLLAAYYLVYFEAEEKFSLKRINSLMVKSGLTPINHSVLETGLSRQYLSMVPDMTGTADVTEYMMTEAGRTATEHLL